MTKTLRKNFNKYYAKLKLAQGKKYEEVNENWTH